MTLYEKIVHRINRNGDINDGRTPRPLLSLEEFFEGNDDPASIGVNLYDQPEPAEFYALFRSIRNRPEVADVLVEVHAHHGPDEWPFTETVWIITTASPEEVRAMLGEDFQPDDVFDDWLANVLREDYAVPEGMKPIGLWWD